MVGMVILVKGAAVGLPSEQRARVDRIDWQKIHITLLGDDSHAIVFPPDLCGLEISDSVAIKFDVTSTRIKS